MWIAATGVAAILPLAGATGSAVAAEPAPVVRTLPEDNCGASCRWCFVYSTGIGFWNPWAGAAAGVYCLDIPQSNARKYRCYQRYMLNGVINVYTGRWMPTSVKLAYQNSVILHGGHCPYGMWGYRGVSGWRYFPWPIG